MSEFTSEVSAKEMLEAMEAQQNDANRKFVSKFWSPKKEGVTKIRFISPLSSFNEKLYYLPYKVHYIGGRPFQCLSQTMVDKNGVLHEAEECPACAKARKLFKIANKDKTSEEWKLALSIAAKERYVSRIVVRGLEDEEGHPCEPKAQFYEYGGKIYEIFLGALRLGECGEFYSLKNGRDFNLSKTGSGRNTDYSGSQLSMNSTPIFTDAASINQLKENLKSMDYKQLIEFNTADEIKAALDEMFNGGSDEAEEKIVIGKPVTADNPGPFETPVTKTEDAVTEDTEKALDDLLDSF